MEKQGLVTGGINNPGTLALNTGPTSAGCTFTAAFSPPLVT